MIRPPRLREGDLVAVLSPSWGGPALYPAVFELGLRNLSELFGVRVREYPTTRMADASPEARAADLNAAFADPEVRAVFASIGGDDSIRLLPYLDLDLVRANPKIVMGFSDTATILTLLNHKTGLVTFNGPSVMAGFAQSANQEPAFAAHVRQILTQPSPTFEYRAFERWTDESIPWGTLEGDRGAVVGLRPHEGWRWLQGSGQGRGRLFGGCLEVLAWLRGTPFWPTLDFWAGRVLFLETSEDKPTPEQIGYELRSLGAGGVLDRLEGLLFGRSRAYSDAEKERSYATMVSVAREYGRPDLPIVANLDFGHTDPQWVIPLGVQMEIDFDARRLSLTETAVG